MPKVAVYNREGKKVGDLNLSEKVFGLPMNKSLVHQVYVSMFSNRRQVIAHAKNRGEVAGSGKKPWRQKGTGNARVGSVRTPVWRKGGVVFGPTKNRNFKKKINGKMKQKAIKIVLSEKVKNKHIFVLDEIKLNEKKTKDFNKIIGNLKLRGSILIGFSGKEKDLKVFSRNIKNVKNISTESLNVFDLLNLKNLILSGDSVKYLEKKYSK